MPTTLVVGRARSGKSSVMAWAAATAYQCGRRIFTNNPTLQFPHVYVETMEDWLDLYAADPYSFDDTTSAFDEIHQFIDSRASSSKTNRLWSQVQQQLTKRSAEMIGTTHLYDMVDRRVRYTADLRVDVRFHRGGDAFELFYCEPVGPDRWQEFLTLTIQASPLFSLHESNRLVATPRRVAREA